MPKSPSSSEIVSIDEAEVSISLVGGKGANLARLARAGFPVPGGFIAATPAYGAYVAANGLADFIVETAEGAAVDDPAALEAASSEIRARFEAGRVPSELEAALRDAYASLGSPAVAVRSSATAEDLPEMSFAGQQDTYLNVLGGDSLIDAVIRCWSSLWTARAIGYRARYGISPREVALAVVVQEMAPAEAAGVMFTADPRTGRRDRIAIDAAFGLGEALVSGQLEPDHYVVSADGRLVSKTLGSKAVSVRARSGGGTETVAETAADRAALPEAAIVELSRIGRRVADLYDGAPQDVEWAWDGNRFRLLQTRPITSLFPLPESVSMEPVRLLLSFGAVQGMLDPITPLGQDTVRGIFAGAAGAFGFAFTPESQPVLHSAAERLFIDFSAAVYHPIGRRIFRAVLPLIEPAAAAALEPLWSDPRLAHGRLPRRHRPSPLHLLRTLLGMAGRVLFSLLRPAESRRRFVRGTESVVDEFRHRRGAARTLAERVALLEEVADRGLRYAIPNLMPRVGAGLGALNLLHLVCRETPGAPDVLELPRGLPHNVTTEMDLALWHTACAIRADDAAAAIFESQEATALATRFLAGELPRAAQDAVAVFLDRYGMRGIAEIDVGRPRWRENPAAIMQVLQSYLKIDPERAPDAIFRRAAADGEAAIERLAEAVARTRGGRLKRHVVLWAARRMRALAGLREAPKFFVVRLFGIAREALLESGRELLANGTLERTDDLFWMRFAELRSLAAGEARDWRGLVAERRRRHLRERERRQIPRLLFSDGEAFYEGLDARSPDADRVTGSPVSPGVAEGVVRVLLDPAGARLEPGEILVCPATDPGWTPLFLAAGGLVMEVGGLMTHGAVVAREYGIPAVVGVHDATTRFASGQRVRVDGSSGSIELLHDRESRS